MVGAGDYPINPVLHIPQAQFKSGIGGTKSKHHTRKYGADATTTQTIQQIRDTKLNDLIGKLNEEGLKIRNLLPFVTGRGDPTPSEVEIMGKGGITSEEFINNKVANKLISDQTVEITKLLANIHQTAKDIIAYRTRVIPPPVVAHVVQPEVIVEQPKLILGMTYMKAGLFGGGILAIVAAGIIFIPKIIHKYKTKG